MSSSFKLNVKKCKRNPLLSRLQFAMEAIHPDRASIPKLELRDYLAKIYGVSDPRRIIIFGWKTHFGGGRSTGFGLIYESLSSCLKYEKKYRLIRFGLVEKPEIKLLRKNKKDIKTMKKKVRGKEKSKVTGASKKKTAKR